MCVVDVPWDSLITTVKSSRSLALRSADGGVNLVIYVLLARDSSNCEN